MADDTVRAQPWDGTPTECCDHIGCPNPIAVHFELSTTGEWAAEADLCEEHLPEIYEQARAFAVSVGVVPPRTPHERNLLATAQEHMP